MGRNRQIEEPLINLTPLIDVVFVILIMFILMAPLLELDRIQLSSGKESHSTPLQESSSLTLHVHADNSVFFLGKPIRLEQLTAVLRKAKKEYPKASLQLFQDKTAHFGTYQSVKNAAEEAGFDQLDLILKPS
ncbi:MAG TPA: biopolymer transporter ExbD [Parachlamydiaceae bacterium]|nr:biopolymer transporter ExbD [Parachlamydiaceae bacterium]